MKELTGKSRQYVYKYLKNMRNYGLIRKNGVFWELTVLGREFVSYLDMVSKHNTTCRKKEETSHPKTFKQILIQPWLRDSNLDDTEKAVVEVLVDHYNKTGSKFILVKDHYELAERCKVNPSSLDQALKRLREDNII